MRYAKWQIIFDTNENQDSTPEIKIKQNGGFIEGAFLENNSTVVGYFDDIENLEDYSMWSMVELSADEFIILAKSKNSRNKFGQNGKLQYFRDEPSD